MRESMVTTEERVQRAWGKVSFGPGWERRLSVLMAEEMEGAIAEAIAALATRLDEPVQDETCAWEYEADSEYWETGCDNAFLLNDGTPKENGMVFCPCCGQRIEEGLAHLTILPKVV